MQRVVPDPADRGRVARLSDPSETLAAGDRATVAVRPATSRCRRGAPLEQQSCEVAQILEHFGRDGSDRLHRPVTRSANASSSHPCARPSRQRPGSRRHCGRGRAARGPRDRARSGPTLCPRCTERSPRTVWAPGLFGVALADLPDESQLEIRDAATRHLVGHRALGPPAFGSPSAHPACH